MSEIRDEILRVLEAQDNRMATAGYVLDTLDRENVPFSMAEFDDALTELREDGDIRVKNISAPQNNWQLKRT